MTDRQPEPTTEAGRRFMRDLPGITGPDWDWDVPKMTAAIIAIEAEARADEREPTTVPWSDDDITGLYQRAYDKGAADERERLAARLPDAIAEVLPVPTMLDVDFADDTARALLALLQPDTASAARVWDCDMCRRDYRDDEPPHHHDTASAGKGKGS